ncbi:hypothetical protein FB567DRAFT_150733 [Paraphoma chrysanthemicola]|uniref:Uncharacterized protein n=1 Tax=Paraphoma chrysanthemicola TaxID=798071 RepID=A0A8K0QWJ9_9PLEO|nr:hypothetical protein FB567DRAFT_150733 [Paraphoma chrysanthemicola]
MLASRSAPKFRDGLSFHRQSYQKIVSQKHTIKGYAPAVEEAHRQAGPYASQEDPITSTHYSGSSQDPRAAYKRIVKQHLASNGTSLSTSSRTNLLPPMWQVARNSKAPNMSFQPITLFNQYLIGALADAPRHLRFRNFISRFMESQRDIHVSLRLYKDLTVLSNYCTSNPEIVTVEASLYRIEQLWKPSVTATISVISYTKDYVAAASSTRMTSLMKRFSVFAIGFYENLLYYQSEHMAMSIRQLQTNQVGAIHAIIQKKTSRT